MENESTEIITTCSCGPPCLYFQLGGTCGYQDICEYQRPLRSIGAKASQPSVQALRCPLYVDYKKSCKPWR